jgi:hypothetical protein
VDGLKLQVLKESEYYEDALYVEIRSKTGDVRTMNLYKEEVVEGIERGIFE